ncbi:sucrase ferredoxin [Nostoc sp.]|uniref:sucrase ferredoxin n=1 Tax=Nostoc sp. TaxID=1180 RepID=UPI002FF77AE1
MITQDSLRNCHFCSLISQTNGEDPIGSAATCEHFFAMEMGLPWSEKRFLENSTIQSAIALIDQLMLEYGVNIQAQLIVPDKEYSHPGYTRILYYRRPAKLFAEFEKQEFIIPAHLVGSFVIALLNTLFPSSEQLSNWQQYRQESNHIRELMICTDGNVDVACGRFGYPIYQQLRSEFAPASGGKLRVWRCSHFGGHQFAPTLIDLPTGHYWGHLQPEILAPLIQRHGSVSELYQYYRGWAGLSKFEQIAEREIWTQEGWDWLNYHKAGQVLAMDEVNQEWADIRIDYSTIDGSINSAYKARVDVSGCVMTSRNSGDNQLLEAVKQYRVSRLSKVV